jgi:hypothetical protein
MFLMRFLPDTTSFPERYGRVVSTNWKKCVIIGKLQRRLFRMKSNFRIPGLLLTGIILLTACTPAAVPTQTSQPTVDVNPIYTAAAQTIEVESTHQAALIPTATATPTLEPTATALPTSTATATEVAMTIDTLSASLEGTPTLWIPSSGDSHPTITARLNTNCRQGPDQSFDVVGALKVGESSDVIGVVQGGGWWYILNPAKEDPKYCWVWSGSTDVSGSTDALPIMPKTTAGMPRIGVTISVSPTSSSTCPQTISVSGTITTDTAGYVYYSFIDNLGNTLKSGSMYFADDGSQSVSFNKKYSSSYNGWILMRVTSPVGKRSGHGEINIACP